MNQEVIEISDDETEIEIKKEEEEEVTYKDIHEVPTVAVPIAVLMEENEEPEEDPEWDDEAAAHDAAIEEAEMAEPDYDPAWDGPVPGLEGIAEGDDAPEDVIAELEYPPYDLDAEMVVGIVQSAADEIQVITEAAEIYRQNHDQELAIVRARLENERRRTAHLTTSLEAARTVTEGTLDRMDRLRAECTDAFITLDHRVERFPVYPGQRSHAISRSVVREMISGTAAHILGRF